MKTVKKIWGENFLNLARSKNLLVKTPTQAQFKKYINFILIGKDLSGGHKETKISLKPLKNSKKSQEKWVWIEIKNSKGEPGWLYGDADFIVFELVNEYLFVVRKNLLNLINSNVDFNSPIVQNLWEAKYKLYQRQGKFDQITQIKLNSLLGMEDIYIWKK